jgi:hypothetical protein
MCEIRLVSGSKSLYYDFYNKFIREMREDKEIGAMEVGSNKF